LFDAEKRIYSFPVTNHDSSLFTFIAYSRFRLEDKEVGMKYLKYLFPKIKEKCFISQLLYLASTFSSEQKQLPPAKVILCETYSYLKIWVCSIWKLFHAKFQHL